MNTGKQGFDVIIPVYNEADNIIKLLNYLKKSSNNISKILICYDYDNDTSVFAIKNSKFFDDPSIILTKNFYKGPCEAVKTGMFFSKSSSVIVFPADDFYNGLILDKMYDKFLKGYDVICPSRLMKGGVMKKCPLLKLIITRVVAFTLFYFARIKTKDPTNGFRMFSKKLINEIPITSKKGFAYSLELLIKAKKKKYKITEVPCKWIEREDRKSTFKIFKWSLPYLKWYFLAFFIF